jgi:hypothetical protein
LGFGVAPVEEDVMIMSQRRFICRLRQDLHRAHRSAPREVLKNPPPALASSSVTISVMSSSRTRVMTPGLDA